METKYTREEEEEFVKGYNTHVENVMKQMEFCKAILTNRAKNHDLSKKEEPERSMFIRSKKILDSSKYGSEEYKKSIEDMKKEALNHHYENNRHHPEHYSAGVEGMSIIDIIEMMCDWCAASNQYGTDLQEAVEVSIKRFNLQETIMANIIRNSLIYFYKYGVRIMYHDGTDKIICSNNYDELISKLKSLPMHISSRLIPVVTNYISSEDRCMDALVPIPETPDGKSLLTQVVIQ